MSEKLWEALDIFKNGGHCKGVWFDGDEHCLIGVLGRAYYGKDQCEYHMKENQLPPGMYEDIQRIADTAVELFPDRATGSTAPWALVVAASDHEDTTLDDAALILEKAAIRADEVLSV